MISDLLSVPLQTQLLTLLCFRETAAQLVRSAVEPRMFSSQVQRKIVDRVYAYLDEFRRPPQAHLPDLIDALIEDDEDNKALYTELMETVVELQTKIDEAFVLSQLETFVRQQSLRAGIVRASEAVQSGDLDGAAAAMNQAMQTQLKVFTPGLTLEDGLSRINDEGVRTDLLSLGIEPLDVNQLGPARGEVILIIAPPKAGKSWFLVHVGKRGLLQKLKVLHITLEISERLAIQRYIQSLFSVQRNQASFSITKIKLDPDGSVQRFTKRTLDKQLSFKDPDAKQVLSNKLGKFYARKRLIVKAFPTRALTTSALRNYLDLLERASNFVPDLLLVDYPDLMKIGSDNYRIEVGDIFRDLRGIAVERNLICAVATQSNRAGASAKMVTDTHASEDFSKIATADTVLTYSQTRAERELGLARIYVSNTRVGEQDKFVTLITQAYRIGQFCLQAIPLPSIYDSLLDNVASSQLEEEEE